MDRRYRSRIPQIGDLLFVTCRESDYNSRCSCRTEDEKHIGFVREIERDSWGHQKRVLVEWSSKPPANYRKEYGYSGVNIHNIREEFTVIRDGIEIK